MHFLLTTLKVAHVLKTFHPIKHEDESFEQAYERAQVRE